MGLFVKKDVPSHVPSYTISLSGRTKLVIGLGNIGKEYINTRHNIGFLILDSYAKIQGLDWRKNPKFKSETSEQDIAGKKIIFIKPTTFMNNSGDAVQLLANFYKVSAEDVLVIHDDIDLDYGVIQTKKGGGSAGHNGVQSVADHIGENFTRIRIGVKNEYLQNTDAADFVLAKFSREEAEHLDKIVREAVSLTGEWTANSSLPTNTIKLL